MLSSARFAFNAEPAAATEGDSDAVSLMAAEDDLFAHHCHRSVPSASGIGAGDTVRRCHGWRGSGRGRWLLLFEEAQEMVHVRLLLLLLWLCCFCCRHFSRSFVGIS